MTASIYQQPSLLGIYESLIMGAQSALGTISTLSEGA